MILAVVALIAGLALLVWSADRFVDGAAATARYAGMPPLLIGMLIVGFGTSAPEMVVSAMAASDGNPALALGNAYGSNITNIALILGLVALLSPIAVHSQVLKKELPILMLVTVFAGWQMFDHQLSSLDAWCLLGVFFVLMAWSVYQGMKSPQDALATEMNEELTQSSMTLKQAIIWLLVGLVLLIAFLSGVYPALILSGMEPLKALGKNVKIGGGAWLRKGLVVFQFFVSIGLLVATLIVQRQLEYMQSVNLGYDREEVVALSYHYNMRKSVGSLKNELLRTGAAQSVTLAADMPIYIKAGYKIFPGLDTDKEMMITGYSVDPDLVKTLGLKIVAGEDFAAEELTRTVAYKQEIEHAVMLNEAAVKELGWTNEEAVGKKLNFGSPTYVKAVVGDFYFNSLHHQVGPLAIMVDPEQANVILAKLPKGNPAEHLAKMEGIWKSLAPDRPFNYKFVDQEYARMYQTEEKIGSVFSLFAGIAIFIACMGLFGLVSYVALRRTREISIRKVLGATQVDVLKVLSADFFVLLGISAVLATAFGIWFSKQWLEGFAYKTTVSPMVYVVAILIVAGISLLTIGYRTVKVNRQNPASTLKDE